MKDTLGKFTLGIVTSVSISAMIFFINKTTPNKTLDNTSDIKDNNNNVLYSPPYKRIVFDNNKVSNKDIEIKIDNKRILPAYKNDSENLNKLYNESLMISYLEDVALHEDYDPLKYFNLNNNLYSKDKYDNFTEYFDI